MHLIILCHPSSLGSTSMPRFARLIGEGMRARGHEVEYCTSPHLFGRLPVRPARRKWLGYIDQFVLFPPALRRRVRSAGPDTVFVVADQALGMWVPAIRDHPHVVHCHDFLAQRSAVGEIRENPTGWTGQLYQRLIRRGYRRARNFISVSEKTRADLHRFLDCSPARSEVVPNPLNYPFRPMVRADALAILAPRIPVDLAGGFILHVGGNQWYKNREGALRGYLAYRRGNARAVPMIFAGQAPPLALRELAKEEGLEAPVFFVEGLTDAEIHAAYAAADVLFFPSLEEGFGWPIIEAQACACLVVTTDAAPMNAIAGGGAFLLRRQPTTGRPEWAKEAGQALSRALEISPEEKQRRIQAGLENVRRFDPAIAYDGYEKMYAAVLAERNGAAPVALTP